MNFIQNYEMWSTHFESMVIFVCVNIFCWEKNLIHLFAYMFQDFILADETFKGSTRSGGESMLAMSSTSLDSDQPNVRVVSLLFL